MAKGDLVMFNGKEFCYDLAERKLTKSDFCRFAGKSSSWVGNICSGKPVERTTAEKVEDLMMVERGKYTIEIEKPVQAEEEPKVQQPVINVDLNPIRLNMNAHLTDVENAINKSKKELVESVAAVQVTNEQAFNRLNDIYRRLNDMVVLMNRMLELWGGANTKGVSK